VVTAAEARVQDRHGAAAPAPSPTAAHEEQRGPRALLLPCSHGVRAALAGRLVGLAWNGGRHRHLPIRLLSFLLCVAAPVALAAAYYGLIAADQYVAELRFGLRSAEPVPGDALSLFAGAAPTGTRFDSYAVVQYLESHAIVDDLDRRLDLRRIFSRPQADWLARLHRPAPIEALVKYWRGQVDAYYDAGDGTVTVRVRAFTPQDAFALARAIAAASERLVNDLSQRARRDSLSDAETAVARSRARLEAALLHLREFRDRVGVIDPRRAAATSAALAASLHEELVRDDAKLATLRTYLRADAPSVRFLEARIHALDDERRSVEGRITTPGGAQPDALSRVMASYDEFDSERRFADAAYRRALAALDRAREEADRQQVYLAGFVPPTLPEEALYPHRLGAVGIVFVIAFALWAIGGLIVQSVRDHL
jgi:capsular polysaccharide transport system permease protein